MQPVYTFTVEHGGDICVSGYTNTTFDIYRVVAGLYTKYMHDGKEVEIGTGQTCAHIHASGEYAVMRQSGCSGQLPQFQFTPHHHEHCRMYAAYACGIEAAANGEQVEETAGDLTASPPVQAVWVWKPTFERFNEYMLSNITGVVDVTTDFGTNRFLPGGNASSGEFDHPMTFIELRAAQSVLSRLLINVVRR